MHAILISLALFGQNEVGLPPAPAPDISTPATGQAASVQTVEEMRTWLLARLIVDLSFDVQKSTEVGRMIENMNEQQMRALIAAYKDRATKKESSSQTSPASQQQTVLDQARLNQQQAEAYRDHLKREFDMRILQNQMTQNLAYQNIVNNQRMLLYSTAPFSNGPYGYGPSAVPIYGFGYGAMNYGGIGYGVPGYGSSLMYGVPYYGLNGF